MQYICRVEKYSIKFIAKVLIAFSQELYMSKSRIQCFRDIFPFLQIKYCSIL